MTSGSSTSYPDRSGPGADPKEALGIDTDTLQRLNRGAMSQTQRSPDLDRTAPVASPAPALHGWYRWFTILYTHPGVPEARA